MMTNMLLKQLFTDLFLCYLFNKINNLFNKKNGKGEGKEKKEGTSHTEAKRLTESSRVLMT